MKVAAVLDNPELQVLKTVMAEMGTGSSDISVFSSDLEALQLMYIHGKPSILVLDLDLPGVIGMETIRAIRQQRDMDSVAVLMLSARELTVGLKASSNTVPLQKPVAPASWVEAIKRGIAAAAAETPAPQPVPQEPEPEAPKDNRRAVRKAFQTPCVIASPTKKMKGILRDISMTGAKVALADPLGAGSIVTLIFAVPNSVPLRVVEFKARIVRQTEDGYGIAFWEMDQATRAFVHAFTNR